MDGLSRERKNATTMKKKLLTMLLVFAVVATYIPFDRAFAADENGKRQDKQVEKKVDKAAGKQEDKKSDASKAQPKKTPADKPESDAGGKDAGKDANKEGASTKSEKGFLPGKTNPGIDVDEPFSAGTLRRRIPYDDESCHLANFVYPSNPNKICFWSKHRNEQKTLTLSDASPHEKANFIDELYREIKHRIGRGGEYDIFISIDPTDSQLSISVPIKKGARIGTSILESIPEIRVMRGDTTYVATGWAESGSHDYTPPANRDVFADTQINKSGFIYATSDKYGKDHDFSKMPEDRYNKVHVTIDTSGPDYYGPKNFKFGKNGENEFTIRKGDSLRKYIKEDLPDNGSYSFAYFYKPGDSAHGDTQVGKENFGYDTPVKDWAKSNNDGSIKIRPSYGYVTSIYVHELPEASSKSVKLASYGTYSPIFGANGSHIPIFDASGAEGAIPHANVKGKVCLGYSTEPDATSAMPYDTIRNNIQKHGKRHLYPVYEEKKKCVIVDYHGGKPAAGAGPINTRFLAPKGANIWKGGYITDVRRDGFTSGGLNIRNYHNWNSVRHGNGAVQWPMWILYGNGESLDDCIFDDAVVDVVWRTRVEEELTSGDLSYNVFEHTDGHGKKYYTYTIYAFITRPDISSNIVIPRVLENAHYKGKYVDATLEKISDESFRNRHLEYVRIKGYRNTAEYIPIRIGKRAFYGNKKLSSFKALKSETDAEFSKIDDEAFKGDTMSFIDVSSCSHAEIGKSAFEDTGLCKYRQDKGNFRGDWKVIGEKAFSSSGLNYFKLSDIEGMKHIGEGAFSHTRIGEKLPGADAGSVEIPASVESIGKDAFASARIRKLKFQGNSLRSIGDGAFQNGWLDELTLPQGINRIGKNAFEHNILKTADISNTAVTEVAEGAFQNNKLISAKLPSSVKTIGKYAFMNNEFEDITLGDGVERIEEDAYRSNPKMVSASISQNLKFLHGDTFYLNPNNRPRVKVNIRENRNPNDLKDSAYHVVYPHMQLKLTFDDNGGSGGPGTIEVEKGKPIGAKFPNKKPTRKGYNFNGWNTSKKDVDTDAGNFDQNSQITEDTTVYATWESKRVDINFDGNGGRNVPKSTYQYFGYKLNDKYNDAYPTQIPIKEGYKFLGWAKTKDAAEPNVTKDTVIDSEGPVTYYAVWQEDKVHVSFNANGGEGAPEKVEVIRNKSLGQTFPARKPTRTGHVFLGWAKSQYATRPDFYSDTPVTQTMTVYAVWRADNVEEVTVTFNVNGGNGSGTTVTVQKGTALEDKFPTMKPEKDGYTFKGWSLNQNASKADFFRSTEVNADTTVYAVWKQNASIENVTVTFNGNGTGVTDVPPAVTIDKGSTLSDQFPKSKPKRDGYIFLGWAKSNVATTPDFFEDTEINHNMNVYAVWRDMGSITDPVTVWFDVNGGSGSFAPVTVERGTSLADAFPKKKPTKSGYRFKGWAKSASATAPDFDKDTIVSGDWTVYAVYEKLENVVPGDQEKPEGYVTITFDLDGKGTTDDPAKCYVKKDTEVTVEAPQVVANTGLRHTGWDKPLKGTFSVDTTIKATYEDVPNVVPGDQEKPEGYVTVTFDLAGKGTTEGKTKYYVNPNAVDVVLTAPKVKAKTGYKHTGWIWKESGNDWKSGEEYQYNMDHNIVATYGKLPNVVPGTEPKPDGYSTVTFNLGENGGTVDTDKLKYHVNPNIKYIRLVPPMVNPHTGYDFTGWTEGGAPWDSEVGRQYPEDTTINAQYKAKPDYVPTDEEKPAGYVTVTFDLDGKATTTDKTSYFVNPEKVVDLTAPKVNEKPGYKFKAWNKQTKAKFTEDTTITALYDKLADVVPGDQDKPNGYSTVVFDLDDKGTTDNTKRFYVNPDKEVELVAPKVKANKGLKFTGWETDGADWSDKVARKYASDTTITAKYTALENIEPGDDEHPNPPSEDYVTVTFDKGEHGKSFEGTSKFYVKKNTDVDLSGKAPKVIPDEDYTFDKWDKPLTGKFNENATITALFIKHNNVIVPENPDDPVPTGYVKVTFDKGDKGDRLVGNSVFFVKKSTDVSLKSKAPVAIGIQGFAFKNWDVDITALNLSENTTVTATYEATAQHKVVYEADGKVVGIEYLDSDAKPAEIPSKLPEKSGYKFIGWQKDGSGDIYLENALKELTITEDTRFVAKYEKEETDKFVVSFEVDGVIKTLEKVNKGDKVTNVPEDPAVTGKTFMGWKIDGKGAGYGKDAVKALTIEKNTAFVASFRDDENVIPSNPTDPVKPGYAKVTFDKGTHGELKGNTVFQVKKDMEIDLTSEAPSVKPAEGWKFTKWNADLKQTFTADTTITAEYKEIYEDDVVVPEKDDDPTPAGFWRVTFAKGEHGEFAGGKTVVFVKKNKEVDLKDNTPKVIAAEGYKFTDWDKKLKQTFAEDTTITAQYKKFENIEVPDNPTDPKPSEEYVRITFAKGEHGTLEGKTVVDVKKNVEVDLKDNAPEVKPADGWKFSKWSKDLKGKFTEDTTITAEYKKLENIEVPDNPTDPKPSEEYVRITFAKGEHGTLEGKTVVDVKKNVEVDLKDNAPKVKVADGWKFSKWSKDLKGKFTEDTTITAEYKKLENIEVPDNPTDPKPSEEYVRITFAKGEHGTLEGKTVVDVKKNVEVDLKDNAPEVKPADGWKFTGWSKDLNGKFNEDTTITAEYEKLKAKEYTVTYKANGTVVDIETVEEDKTPTNVPDAPAKEGHKFIGWQKDGTGDIYTKEALKKIKITENTTYVAKYEEVAPEQYLVRFVADGAVVHSESVAKNGKLAKVPDDPKVSGYIFEGWQKDGAGKLYSKAELKDLAVEENVTFIAKLEKEKDIVVPENPDTPKPSEEYARITFAKGEHGTLEGKTVVDVKKNKEVDLNDNAPKVKPADGWKFSKWSKDLKGKFTEDTTITAEYKKLENIEVPDNPTDPKPSEEYVRITFAKGEHGTLEGKTVVDVKKNVEVDLKDNAPEVKPADGWKFTGWSKDLNGKFNEDTTITAEYEKLKAKEYTVTYKANGTVVDIETVEEDKTPTNVPEAPAKEGHKFIGWQKDGTGDIYTKEALKKIKITENTTYVAKYEEVAPEQYLVRFVADGAVVHSESVAKNGKLAKVPDDPKVSGYIFEGWQKDGAGKLYSKAELKDLAVEENVTFIAKLEKEKDIVVPDDPDTPKPSEEYARITFAKGEHGTLEGKTVVDVKKNVEVDLKDNAPEVKPADGWKFTGWSKDLKGKFTEDTTITAEYKKLENIEPGTDPKPSEEYVKVTFKLGEHGKEFADGDSSFYVKKNVEVELKGPKVLPKDGYKFTKWNKDLKGKFTEDTEITAQYEELKAEERVVTYKADDKIVGIEYVESGKTPANVPDAPAKEGHKFIGWQKDGTGDIYTKDALEKIKISENTTYVAKYEEIAKEEYAVNFVVDGKVVKTAKVTKGNTLTEVPEDPKVDGYKFKGWQKDGEGKVYDKDTLKDLAIKGDTVFVASLEKDVKDEDIVVPDDPDTPKPSEEYARITFAKGEHGSLEGKTVVDVKKNKEVDLKDNAPKVKAADGWKFTGWSKDLKGKFTEDTTITAEYKKLENVEPGTDPKPSEEYVKVEFKLGEHGKEFADGDSSFYVKKNVEVELKGPKVLPKDGYKFTKWSKDLKGKFTEDTEITAQYEELKAEERVVTYKADDKIVGIEYVESGKTPANVPDAPAKEGHKFIGWQKDGKGDTYTKDALGKVKISENATYVAKYEEVPAGHKLVIFAVDGKVVDIQKVVSGKKLEKVPEEPKVEGFTFEGWKMEGTNNIYSADRVKDLEINKDTTFVASLKKKAEPAKPDDKKPEQPKPATPAKPAAPVTPNVDKAGRSPLLIKSSKTINLTAEQQKGMAEGKYSYMELTVKNITIKVTPEEFKSMYKANNLKTYFKVATKSKKFIKSKALKKKIFKGKVYMLNMVISGTQMKKLNNVGIASVGKVKAKTKFKMMKLLGKKAKGKKAKKAFSLLKKGGLYKASFDKKTKKVYFNTKGNLKKMYFGLVKIQPKKKAKKARRAR